MFTSRGARGIAIDTDDDSQGERYETLKKAWRAVTMDAREDAVPPPPS
jgi:hypothetical protein